MLCIARFVLGLSVGAASWTSGLVLASLVAHCSLRGVRVLEVGCGLGLVGLAAATAGGEVTVTDRSTYALAFTAVNAEDNGLAVETVRCEWSDPTPLRPLGPWDLVLGSDVIYEERSAYHLHILLDRVVAADGEVWQADPGRAPAGDFVAAAAAQWRHSRRSCGYGVCLHRLVRISGTERDAMAVAPPSSRSPFRRRRAADPSGRC